MGKHTDELGSIDSFNAPWETAAGEVDIDKSRLKKYIFNLLLDKAKAQDTRDETAEKVTELETKVTEADKAVKDAKDELAKGDSTGKIGELTDKLAKAEDEAKKARTSLDKLEVGLEAGLTPKQAARLQGDTREELEADAKEVLETFGVKTKVEDDDDNEDEDEDDDSLRSTPRNPLRNPADPAGDAKNGELDYDKIVDSFPTFRLK